MSTTYDLDLTSAIQIQKARLVYLVTNVWFQLDL